MIAILFFSKDADSFCKITNDIRFAQTGTAYVVDENGTNIMNNDIEKVKNKVNRIEDAKTDSSYEELADITKKMISGESGAGSYKFDGKTKFLGYAPVENTGWSVGITCDLADMLSQMNNLIVMLIIIGTVALIIMLIVSYFIADKISKRLVKLKDEVEEISTGNFEAKEINETINDEITAIYNSLEDTKKSVGNMINVIKESADELNNESTQLKNISEIFIEGTSNINDSIAQATKGTESQASELSEINIILNDFDAKMNESKENIDSINKKSKDISNKANDSCEDMENLSKFMEVLNDSFASFAKEILEMVATSEEISVATNEFVVSSTDIKDSTDNLSELTSNMEKAVNQFRI
ncbi:HAMP domain-containing protein [Clostridium sp. DSM 8431]|nr:HAMP domain-containing protein [Clostridium sp. DSM 8431]